MRAIQVSGPQLVRTDPSGATFPPVSAPPGGRYQPGGWYRAGVPPRLPPPCIHPLPHPGAWGASHAGGVSMCTHVPLRVPGLTAGGGGESLLAPPPALGPTPCPPPRGGDRGSLIASVVAGVTRVDRMEEEPQGLVSLGGRGVSQDVRDPHSPTPICVCPQGPGGCSQAPPAIIGAEDEDFENDLKQVRQGCLGSWVLAPEGRGFQPQRRS